MSRSAFTLIEAIVSIGILLILMTLIGAVFSLTGRASTQSNAVLSVHSKLRAFREALKHDLDGVNPEESALAITSVLVPTFETPQDRAAGVQSLHRADVLMFFTNNRARPYADPADRGSASRSPVEVVYGHANLAELNPGVVRHPFAYLPNPPRLVESTAMNASEWHLARRVVMFDQWTDPTPPALPLAANGGPAAAAFLDPQILQGNTDLIPNIFAGANPFDYDFWVRNQTVTSANNAANFGMRAQIQKYWYYDPALPGSGRTQLDPTPPPGIVGPQAFYMLPGCADFKVEYTYDDPASSYFVQPVQWLDPLVTVPAPSTTAPAAGRMEWIAGNLNQLASATVPANALSGSSSPDFTYLKTAYGPDFAGGANVPAVKPLSWPKAIRITVRVYDQRGALGEVTADTGGDYNNPVGSERKRQYQPIEMVFVHAF